MLPHSSEVFQFDSHFFQFQFQSFRRSSILFFRSFFRVIVLPIFDTSFELFDLLFHFEYHFAIFFIFRQSFAFRCVYGIQWVDAQIDCSYNFFLAFFRLRSIAFDNSVNKVLSRFLIIPNLRLNDLFLSLARHYFLFKAPLHIKLITYTFNDIYIYIFLPPDTNPRLSDAFGVSCPKKALRLPLNADKLI